MENTEIVKSNAMIIRNVDDLSRVGKMMAVSGFFEDAKDTAQAAVKVAAGMEMGFGPFASMTGIHIIKGKPAVGANLMAAAVKANPHYDYRVRKMEDDVVMIEFFERVGGKLETIGTSTFTAQDAAKAGTQNMGKFPRNMLFARAISNGIKWFCPDVFAGNATYVPEELGAEVDDDGNVISLPQDVPVIEAETIPVIEPVPERNAPEKPQKREFNESEFLAQFSRPGSVPDISTAAAETYTASDNRLYKDMSTEELFGHWCGLAKRIKKENPAEAELTAMTIGAICRILYNRKLKNVPEPNGGRQDPFVNQKDA